MIFKAHELMKSSAVTALLTMVVGLPAGGAAQNATPARAAETRTITNSEGMKLVRIEPGTFTMGQDGPPMEDYLGQKRMGEMYKDIDRIDFDEKPAHRVTITQPFLMGVTEVTVAQFRQFDPAFRTKNPTSKPADEDAASGISWDKAVAFCEWLSKREGKTYRLPTEAEWEYACRAGTTTLFHTGDALPAGHQKWFGDQNFRSAYFPPGPMPREYDWRKASPGAAKSSADALKFGQLVGANFSVEESKVGGTGSLRVAQKTPNAWGLHDMHGNVAEWCLDWYGPYESGSQTDPRGRTGGNCRVFRGGHHSALIRFLRSANRGSMVPFSESDRLGFRVVQAELPKGKVLPVAPLPLNAHNVSQAAPNIVPQPVGVPFFEGPKHYVRISDDAVGPVYCSENHSPSITECPNGDLLAVWFSTPGETDLTTAHAASRLRLGAKEWEPASPFWDAADVNDHTPQIWWDGDKRIYHISSVIDPGGGCSIVRYSTDNGVTWSKPGFLSSSGLTANNMIRTKEGVMAVPYDDGALMISRDNGKSWQRRGRNRWGTDDVRPGGSGPLIVGQHAALVQLADGRLLTFSRPMVEPNDLERFDYHMPASYSSNLGETWQWDISPFPTVTNTQKPVLLRLKEGPILLCSFTDQWREWRNRKGLVFKSTGGDYTGYGLYAAVSYDEGKTWPDRRLLTPGGPERKWIMKERTPCLLSDTLAEPTGYLAVTQSRDGNIQLLTSRNHYTFNLAWIKALPPTPKK